ncbi:glycosyl transferase [Pseudarthrobacter polychromogenes]|uniref:Glycosyl transferase n=1 Tax=Pseudarthrobacter polychromogenes TaxID=1676 RepID=A0ABQ1XSP6_9MICC|nr:glycosyl transferase [Pseudarthrobacter polychromogenes]
MGRAKSTVTAAVVSTFNPQANLIRNCLALLEQCSEVVVVDDGSTSPDEAVYAQLGALGCVVLRLESNMGIAAALNKGVEVARLRNAALEFVLTMDQDSLVPPGFVHALEHAAAAAAAAGLSVGMVSPGKVSGLPSRPLTTHKGVVIGDEPVQSGLLIPVASLDKVGQFNEKLFIDGVDSEFYLRAKANKLLCIIAPGPELVHSLGAMVPARIGSWHLRRGRKPLMVRTAAPWRYYFIVRNRVLLARRFALQEPYWSMRGLVLDLRHLLLVSVLAPGRRERLSYARLGLRDGLLGRSGPRPEQ